MKKLLKRSLVIFVFLFMAIQFVSPVKTNPPVDPSREIAAVHPPGPDVSAVLQRSCNDCHSNRTVWPWYSHIAPASWLVTHDVNEGRDALNFSEWAQYNAEKSQKLLGKVCEEARDGEMPVSQYTLLHPHARLTAPDVQVLCSWTVKAAPGAEAAREKDEDD